MPRGGSGGAAAETAAVRYSSPPLGGHLEGDPPNPTTAGGPSAITVPSWEVNVTAETGTENRLWRWH